MGDLVVVGAGICGLGAALLLARDGHRVTVLEKDPTPAPESLDDCWEGWARKGVAQFHQPHNFMPGLRAILESELPDVQEDLVKAGACRFDMLNPIPPHLRDSPPQPIDDKLWTWTCRRPTGEWVFLKAAERDSRIEVRRGTTVESLITGLPARDGTPHVGGVRTASGEQIHADLVIDATGRGSRAPEWLRTIDVSVPPDDAVDCNFTYLTRHFTGGEPERLAPPLTEMGSISILTLMGDRNTWSVTVFISSRDRELKRLRNAKAWTNVVRASPLHAHWLQGEPISDVLPMSGVVDRYRRFAGDAGPPVSGFVTVADACACTNPSSGRGITVGMLHARLLRDSIRRFGDDPWKLTSDFDERTEVEIRPWYDAQIAVDRARFAEMESCRTGEAPPLSSDPLTRDVTLLRTAMIADAELFRLGLEYIGTLATAQDIMNRQGVRRRFEDAAVELHKNCPPPLPGPSREQLVELAA